MKNNLVSLLVLASLTVPAVATAEIITDRPDIAESSRTVGAQAIQLEIGVDTSNFGSVTFPTKFRYGIIDPLEVHLESGIVGIDDSGANSADIDVGGKWHIFESHPVSMGLLAAVTAPLASDAVLLRPTLAVDLDLGFLGIGTNIGADIPVTERDTSDDVLRFAAALGVGVTERIGVFAEVFGNLPIGSELILGLDAGGTFALNPTNQLDLYVRLDDVANSQVFGLGAGYSVKF